MNECATKAVPDVDEQRVFGPDVDIFEDGDALVLLANVPGCGDSQTAVTIEKNVLSITAEADAPILEGYRRVHSEYDAGRFERSFTLPREVDLNRIEAGVRDGILRVTLPRTKEAGLRRIDVRTN